MKNTNQHDVDAMANVLGIGVHAMDMESAVARMRLAIDEGRKGYVCVAGVHGVMEARRHADLRETFAQAYMVVPDGMPTVWMGHLQGLAGMQRVTGPDLMLQMIGRKELAGYRHFLCGGGEGVAEQLREELMRRFPWASIVGTYTPPFRAMTVEEDRELAAQVQAAQADMVWVGMSTPKQDRFMQHMLPLLETKLMVGVGAAFLYHTGAIKDSPEWVKRAGLQWFHRLLQEPRRLWRRYLVIVPSFLLQATLQVAGLRTYGVRQGVPQAALARQEQRAELPL